MVKEEEFTVLKGLSMSERRIIVKEIGCKLTEILLKGGRYNDFLIQEH